jgi:hypothetical protein
MPARPTAPRRRLAFDEHHRADRHEVGGQREPTCGIQGAPGREHVVDQQHARRAGHDTGAQFQHVLAVLQRVARAVHGAGQLAALADRHEAASQVLREPRAEDETARRDPRDVVDVEIGAGRTDRANGGVEPACIGEQRRDVAEQDAGRGEVRDAGDQTFEVSARRFGSGRPVVRPEPALVGRAEAK